MIDRSNDAFRNHGLQTALFEVSVVFLAMLGLTWLAQFADLTGAGSIAIWGGIGVATVFMRRKGLTWSDFGLTRPRGKGDWIISCALALTAAIVIVAILAISSTLLAKLGFREGAGDADRFRFFLGNPYLFAGYLISVVWVGAALGEELFMRGFILNRLADMFGRNTAGWRLAILLQAVVFGAMHYPQGSVGMITTGLVGLAFGAYYVIGKKRLFPIILAHGFVNTIGVTAYYLSDGAIT